MKLARHTPHVDEAALLRKHRPLADALAANYYIAGADSDDVKQEAMIGLLIAARTYDGTVPFKHFARLVITKWLQTEMTRASREKRRVLSEAVRVMRGPETGIVHMAADLIEDPAPSIAESLVWREDLANLVAAARSLTVLERRAVMGLAEGFTYAQLSDALGGESFKAIDNATQRARRKLREAA